MKHNLPIALLASALLLSAVQLFAHHSFAAEYDSGKPITLKGKVTQFEWVKPSFLASYRGHGR
jgi:hypothetical protein